MIRYGLTLGIICMAAAGLLSGVNFLTKPRIIAQAQAEEEISLKEVIPAAARFEAVKSGDKVSYYKAFDLGGRLIGAAFQASTKGYSSTILTIAGMLNDGTITAIKVLSQNETPGLGAKICESDFTQQFKNKVLYLKLPPDKNQELRQRVMGNVNIAGSSYKAPITGTRPSCLPLNPVVTFGRTLKTYEERVRELDKQKWKTRVYETKIINLAASISKYHSDTLQRFQNFCLLKTAKKQNITEYELANMIKGLKIIFEQTVLCKKED